MTLTEQINAAVAGLDDANLTGKEQQALWARLRGMNLAEFARAEGVSESTVRVRLAKAVRKIRAKIPGFEIPAGRE